MNVFDNGGFIGRTADYSDTSFYTVSETLVFSDDFETFSGWTTQGSGVLSQSSTQAYAGTYSAYKTTNGDPSGAYKLLDSTVNREYIVEAWIFSEEPRAGGTADRISIVDASGNGYGLYLGTSVVYCERRDALSSTLIGTSTWTRPSNAWYRVTLEAKSDNTFVVTTYNTTGTQLGTVTSSVDTTHSGPFDRVMILGGANYYVDNLTVRNLETVNKNKKNSGLWNLYTVFNYLKPTTLTLEYPTPTWSDTDTNNWSFASQSIGTNDNDDRVYYLLVSYEDAGTNGAVFASDVTVAGLSATSILQVQTLDQQYTKAEIWRVIVPPGSGTTGTVSITTTGATAPYRLAIGSIISYNENGYDIDSGSGVNPSITLDVKTTGGVFAGFVCRNAVTVTWNNGLTQTFDSASAYTELIYANDDTIDADNAAAIYSVTQSNVAGLLYGISIW